MDRLTPISPGVVHSSAYRTRLKSPKWHGASEDDVALVKDALERVPGVIDVKPMSSGFVIEHEARADVVENIGVALSEVSPVLLEHLTEEEEPRAAKIKVQGLFEKLKLDNMHLGNLTLPDFSSENIAEAAPIVKKAIPAVLTAAGAMLLLEGQSLLAGVGPPRSFLLGL